MIALSVFILIVLACLFLPYCIKWNYRQIDLENMYGPPSWEHVFGTDSIGRDLLTRLLYGGRVTLGIMAVATVLAAMMGFGIGLLSGTCGGAVDFYVMRVVDVIASVPGVLLAVMIEVALGMGKGNFKYGLAIAAMPGIARMVRTAVLEVMQSEYVEASRALGAGRNQIIRKHVLHNVAVPFIIQTLGAAAEVLLSCTVMGYLGLGINPPTPEWGGIVHDTRELLRVYPSVALIPSGVIVVTEMSLHFIGNGLRDAFDPRNDEK